MPHVIIEYSSNIEQLVDVQALLISVHEAALASRAVPSDALRTRLEPRLSYLIADAYADNAFVAVTARLGPGRTPDEKHALMTVLLTAVESALGAAAANAMLSVELQEIDAEFRVNKNNLRTAIADRSPNE